MTGAAAATSGAVVQITFSIIAFPIAAKIHDSGIFN
jgi:hypothetical protein